MFVKAMKTFIRRPGNKTKHLRHIIPLIPKEYNTYIEPFVGTGAVFLELLPDSWIINDLNTDIINIWKLVRDDPVYLLKQIDIFKKHFLPLSNEEKLTLCKNIVSRIKTYKNKKRSVRKTLVISNLEKQDYIVYPDLYNTKNYGLPQNRERIYIVAIKNDILKNEYKKPDYKPMKPFEKIIINKKISRATLPEKYKKNLNKLKPLTKIITPRQYYSPIENVSPTLDSTCKDFYLIKYNRLITAQEALLLQGFPENFKQVVSDTQFMKQLGNTMSVNVLKEIIKNSLISVGLIG